MKKVLLSSIFLFVTLIGLTGIINAEDNTAFQICKEKQDACKATCDSSSIRPLKKKRCKSNCDVSYHECRERELHQIDKKEATEDVKKPVDEKNKEKESE